MIDVDRIHRSVHRCVVSEVDVGELHVSFYLQHVNLMEGMKAVLEVKQMLSVHKHLKLMAPAANGDLKKKKWDQNKREIRHC